MNILFSMEAFYFTDIETVVDIILLCASLLVLFIGCRGMMRSGIRSKSTYIYITIVGLVVGVIELLDVFELMPRSVFPRTLIGTSEVFVILSLLFALYLLHTRGSQRV